MKKLVFVFVFAFVLVNGSWAQKREGEFSFIPRVGLNLSNLGEMSVCTIDESVHKSAVLPDFMLGFDVEYQLLKPLGLSLGAYYSRQGCRWSTFYDGVIYGAQNSASTSNTSQETGYEDQSMKLQYINIPLNVKYYVNDFLSVHAGVQAGIYLKGSYDCTTNDITINTKTGERTYGVATKNHQDMADETNHLVWAVPVGVSLEYEHAIVDVSYSFPLSHFTNDYWGEGGNRVWTISVGYRL